MLAYDGFDRLAEVRQRRAGRPNLLVSTYGYDLAGNPVERVENAEQAPDGSLVTAGRRQTVSYDQRGLPTVEIDFGLDAGSADDRRITRSYTATGLVGRILTEQGGAGAWAAEQEVVRSFFRNGLPRMLTTRNGAGELLESHTLVYENLDGLYLDGNRTSDTFRLLGPDTSAPCRTTNCTRTFAYDPMGRLIREQDGHGATTEFHARPGRERGARVRHERRVDQHAHLHLCGPAAAEHRRGGVVSKFFYTVDGALSCVTDSTGVAADCRLPTDVEPPARLKEAYAYDYRGRLASYRAFEAGVETGSAGYRYDPLDRPVEETETGSGGSPRTTLFEYLGLSTQVAREEQRTIAVSVILVSRTGVGRRAG